MKLHIDDSELQQQHFSSLLVQYQVMQRESSAFNSFLYLILRKASLGIQITDIEIQWLKEQRLFRTIEIISLQQYRAEEQQRLENELGQLKAKYRIPPDVKLAISSPIYSLLWKLDTEAVSIDLDLKPLEDYGFAETINLIQKITNFAKLKIKYKATQFLEKVPQEPLDSILKRLESREQLSDSEKSWLLSNNFRETVQIYLKQEDEKKEERAFRELKSKYQSIPTEFPFSAKLHQILKKLDKEQDLESYECDWLKKENLLGLVEFDQRRKDWKYFAELKRKYKVALEQDPDPSNPLFLILRKLEIANFKTFSSPDSRELANCEEFQILESDIQYLSEQKLHQTAETAKQLYFKELKAKYRIVGQLAIDPFYEIMLKLERQERLDPKQVIQLIEAEQLSPHGKIAIAHYKLEAEFCEKEYRRTGNKRHLASVSSNWRKADEPEAALKATENINWSKIQEVALKSALLVTRGAALRDLGRLDEAESHAVQARDCQPNSYQPYTLLGAIKYNQGSYVEGDRYFAMAEERGANDTDYEIKRIVHMTRDKQKRKEVAAYLVKKDPDRYAWAKAYLRSE